MAQMSGMSVSGFCRSSTSSDGDGQAVPHRRSNLSRVTGRQRTPGPPLPLRLVQRFDCGRAQRPSLPGLRDRGRAPQFALRATASRNARQSRFACPLPDVSVEPVAPRLVALLAPEQHADIGSPNAAPRFACPRPPQTPALTQRRPASPKAARVGWRLRSEGRLASAYQR